jgi:site-specific DNA-methyltransferase (adenine-specific)
MPTIDSKKINYLYNKIDEIIMSRYEETKKTYLDLLVEVSDILTDQIDSSSIDLSEDNHNTIDEIEQYDYNSEEVRLAMQLLIIQGLKHKNIPVDVMTPDGIALLFAFIIKQLMNKRSDINILDVALGTGNLLLSIANHLQTDHIGMVGIENNESLVKLAKANADMQYHNIDIYFQDTLQSTFRNIDFVIGDLDSYLYEDPKYQSYLIDNGVRDFPYLAIENHLKSGYEESYYIFLIPNDFFSKKGNIESKQVIDTYAKMLGLIVLPPAMFVSKEKGKSILILKNKSNDDSINTSLEVFNLPSMSDSELFTSTLTQIGVWLKKHTEF